MEKQIIKFFGVFTGLPLLLWALGAYHRDTVLKEVISVLTLLAFCLMIGQFFLTRTNREQLKGLKMSRVVQVHKFLGYLFVGVLLVHPFLIVVPRFFEAGVSPQDAFMTMVTTFDSNGILLGIIAWVLMGTIGVTSFLRSKLGMSYRTWRVLHGILSISFISLAGWHVIKLGRHINTGMTVFILFFILSGVLLLLGTYFIKPAKKKLVR